MLKFISRGNEPSSVLCLIAVLIGFFVGVLLLPDYPRTAADLRLPAMVFSLGLVFVPLATAFRKPESLLHPISILLFGIVYWVLLDLIQALYLPQVINPGSIYLAFLATALFAAGVCLAGVFRVPRLPRLLLETAFKSVPAKLLFRIGCIAFILAFLRYAIPADFDMVRMYDSLFSHRWAAPWARGAYGGWDAFLDHMAYFGYVLPVLAVLCYRGDGRLTWRTVVLVTFALITILLIAQGGGRRIVGALVGSAGVAWVLTARHVGRGIIVLSLVGLPTLLTYLQYILFTRGTGIGQAGRFSFVSMFSQGIHVDDNFNRLCQIIEAIPQHASHVGFDWLLWLLVRPIPRVFWPGKPDSIGFDLTSYLGMQNVSLTSSVIGESYIAFGFAGCLLTGFVFGYSGRVLGRFLEYKKQPSAILMYSLGLLTLFVGLRSAVEVVLFSYAVLAWILLAHFFARRRLRRNLSVAGTKGSAGK